MQLIRRLQNETLDDETKSEEHDDAQAGEVERQEEQDVSQQTGLSGVRQGDGGPERRRVTGRRLGHLAVHACPALVALAGELLPHVQDVMVVEVPADVEAGAPARRVQADVEEARVQVQASAGVQALADAAAVLLAKRFAAKLGGGRDVDDIMSQRAVDVLLHGQAVPLREGREGEGRPLIWSI